jgi:uncharacterized protein YdeI (YjbR/CyaY-like superfamily)
MSGKVWNPKVDAILAKSSWAREMAALREIALGCGLDEVIKWGQPCYTSRGRNIVLIHGFNDYCALLFFKGALMRDAHKLLVRQTENVQSGRQIRFAGMADIAGREAMLKAYVLQAVEVETSGAKVEKQKAADMPWPAEMQEKFARAPELAEAFSSLTPGRQRAYLLHFAAPKQARTREARIEKCTAGILAGKGLDD